MGFASRPRPGAGRDCGVVSWDSCGPSCSVGGARGSCENRCLGSRERCESEVQGGEQRGARGRGGDLGRTAVWAVLSMGYLPAFYAEGFKHTEKSKG